MADKILTPRKKRITVRQYLALRNCRFWSPVGASPCEHGHYDCAAWEHGPCSQELAAAHDIEIET